MPRSARALRRRMILVDGTISESIPATDRGLAYGDGVFRTMCLHDGRIPFWAQHYDKLAADCAALSIACPSHADLEGDIRTVLSSTDDGVIKIIVTRGTGQRGYRFPDSGSPRRIVMHGPLPVYPSDASARGINARICNLRLSHQPALAGIKHLNRLEQVLARNEWTDPFIAEGILCDVDGLAICGTMTNLFISEQGALVTPALDRCGVAGVTRHIVMEEASRRGIACRVERISIDRLRSADGLFLTNSVIGVWPVRRLETTIYTHDDPAISATRWLSEASA